MYKIVLSKEAAKYYRKVDERTRNRLDDVLDAIENNPFDVQHHDIKPLHEPLKGLWRYRVGKIRVILSTIALISHSKRSITAL